MDDSDDFSHPGSALEGSELLSINGVPTKQPLNQFRANWTGDGNMRTARSWLIGDKRLFGVNLCAYGIESHFRVTYQRPEGKRQTGELVGMTTSGWTATLTLPNSKLVLPIGLVTYSQAVSGYKYPDRGVMPDYPVTYTVADALAGKDKDMELALSLARAQ